jgi:hypothetical protein
MRRMEAREHQWATAKSTVRGALYESTSIAAVYGTISLTSVGIMGQPAHFNTRTLGTRTRPETSGNWRVREYSGN